VTMDGTLLKQYCYKAGFLVIFLFFLCSTNNAAYTQELFFTYIGATIIGGTNSISYEGWVDNKQSTIDSNGAVYGGGLIACIFVRQFAGEFSLTYMQYTSDSKPDVAVSHPVAAVKGKYFYPLHAVFQPGIAVGLYLDLPPASSSYDGGAGGNIAVCSAITLSSEIKMLIDIYAQYGSFGMGESSTKKESGIALSVVYKMGRL